MFQYRKLKFQCYLHRKQYCRLRPLCKIAAILRRRTVENQNQSLLTYKESVSYTHLDVYKRQNLDCYGFYPGVSDEETLGRKPEAGFAGAG